MNFKTTHGDIDVSFLDGRLRVSNSRIYREWDWTGKGLATSQLNSVITGKTWVEGGSKEESDWLLPGYDHLPEAELKDISAKVSDDEGFTSEHICVRAEIKYPSVDLEVRYSIWIYPHTPGLRTHLSLKGKEDTVIDEGESVLNTHQRVDHVPVSIGGLRRRMFGYYNETQQRNDTCEDILKEEVLDVPLKNREFHTWPSALCLENEKEGIAIVKESHKCPNQPGYDCGLFICDQDKGLSVLGWGLQPKEIDESWRHAWASWCIVYEGGDFGRTQAIKNFDGARYPLDEKRDVYVQANTWGSCYDGEGSRFAAVETEVLKELESCADLGIDTLQIDDGWQVVPGHKTWIPDEENGWHPHVESYPNGWGKVKAKAEELGVKLGLWAAAMPVSLEELQSNFRDGGFLTYKLDFADLNSNQKINELMQKVREFIKSTGHKVRVNWDVTEVCRRYGYFFAREFGCLYLANRKPVHPPSTTYRPHTMLKDMWHLSKYINLRKVQGSIQNIDRVNTQLSDADLHTHEYCVATTLMGTPLFFQQTVHYGAEAREQIRPLLKAYRSHQNEIFKGMVHPIGEQPNNYSWSGFQSHHQKTGSGYLTIFRELNNDESKKMIKLEFLENKSLTITNLLDGTQRKIKSDRDGNVEFECDKAPGYLFLKYE